MTTRAMVQPVEALAMRTLGQLEAQVERGYAEFINVGEALAEIRDRRLYQPRYASFPDYLMDRWRFGYRRASQVIDSARVGKIVHQADARLPLRESWMRELRNLEPSQAVEIYRAALEEHDGKPTASQIKAVRVSRYPTPAERRRSERQQSAHAMETIRKGAAAVRNKALAERAEREQGELAGGLLPLYEALVRAESQIIEVRARPDFGSTNACPAPSSAFLRDAVERLAEALLLMGEWVGLNVGEVRTQQQS
jgi:hypothetical protein